MKSAKMTSFRMFLSVILLFTETVIGFTFVVPSSLSQTPVFERRKSKKVLSYDNNSYVRLFSKTTPIPQAYDDDDGNLQLDTVRVRIWRVLMSSAEKNEEMSLKDLSKAVKEKPSDVSFHLQHVEKQAKTLANKSIKWRERRGIPPNQKGTIKIKKRYVAITKKRKELHIKLDY